MGNNENRYKDLDEANDDLWSVNESGSVFDMLDFQGLDCWKKAKELRIKVSQLVKKMPRHEQFELISQIRRSSRSVCANIAEGYGRFHTKESMQFCRQARGPLTETYDHLITAFDEEYITADDLSNFKNIISTTGRLLNGYIRFLNTQIESQQSSKKTEAQQRNKP